MAIPITRVQQMVPLGGRPRRSSSGRCIPLTHSESDPFIIGRKSAVGSVDSDTCESVLQFPASPDDVSRLSSGSPSRYVLDSSGTFHLNRHTDAEMYCRFPHMVKISDTHAIDFSTLQIVEMMITDSDEFIVRSGSLFANYLPIIKNVLRALFYPPATEIIADQRIVFTGCPKVFTALTILAEGRLFGTDRSRLRDPRYRYISYGTGSGCTFYLPPVNTPLSGAHINFIGELLGWLLS